MKIIFTKPYLKELYSCGTAQDKKHRFQPHIIRRYNKTIGIMIGVKNALDLARINSLRYEKLKGDKYRLEFEEHSASGEDIATICSITELSNHYK